MIEIQNNNEYTNLRIRFKNKFWFSTEVIINTKNCIQSIVKSFIFNKKILFRYRLNFIIYFTQAILTDLLIEVLICTGTYIKYKLALRNIELLLN